MIGLGILGSDAGGRLAAEAGFRVEADGHVLGVCVVERECRPSGCCFQSGVRDHRDSAGENRGAGGSKPEGVGGALLFVGCADGPRVKS